MRTASDTLQHRRTARLRRFDARERPLYLHPRRLVADDHVRSNDGGGNGTRRTCNEDRDYEQQQCCKRQWRARAVDADVENVVCHRIAARKMNRQF